MILLAVLGTTKKGPAPRVGNLPKCGCAKSRERQILENRRALLDWAGTHFPASYSATESLQYDEMRAFLCLEWIDAELQLAESRAARVELCQRRLDHMLATGNKLQALHDAGARGGELWLVLRNRCRVIRSRLALLRETAGGAPSSCVSRFATLRATWLTTADDYLRATREEIGKGFVNQRNIFPALTEFYDAKAAVARTTNEKLAIRRQYIDAIKTMESTLQKEHELDQKDSHFLRLTTHLRRIEAELRLEHDEFSTHAVKRRGSAHSVPTMENQRLTVRKAHLAAAEQLFWDKSLWIEELLEAYHGTCAAEVDACANNRQRQEVLTRWIDQLAMLESRTRIECIYSIRGIWVAECAAERLQLMAQLQRLKSSCE
ncbi:MAG TPA: hypothetical protein VGN12_22045 [Pirellulales bacterium]